MEVKTISLLIVILINQITVVYNESCHTETHYHDVQERIIDHGGLYPYGMTTESRMRNDYDDDDGDYHEEPQRPVHLNLPLNTIANYTTTCEYLTSSFTNLNQIFDQQQYDHHLIIRESNITTIPPSAFINCCNFIKTLQMNDVSIVNIEPGAFNGLQKLLNLSLNNNEIETITRGVFNSLNNLEILDLSFNKIRMIETKSFTGLISLTTLLLNNNDLINLESNLFDDFKHLKSIDLSGNVLESIDLKFSNLERLNIAENQLKTFEIDLTKLFVNYVNLSNNEISNIDFSLFPRLDQLDLSNNNLNNLTNWSYLSCGDINLNYNQLDHIGVIDKNTRIFRANNNNLTNLESMIGSIDKEHIRNLIEFDVSFNEIRKLDQNIFIGFTILSELYLQHNQINKIESGCFRYLNALRILDLSLNQLNYLPYGLFDQLINLQSLNLSHNYITNFNYYSFNSLKNLNQLYLDHNLIKSLPLNDLSLYLINLKQISLDGNKFYCKDLTKLFHTLTKYPLHTTILPGTTFNRENVKGIPCYTDLNNNYVDNNDFYNSSFYRFFQFDFEKSNFFKFFKNYNNNNNETIEKIGNFDYLSANHLNDNGENYYKTDPVIVGVLIFLAIIVFLLTINFYVMKRQNTYKDRIVNC